MRNIFLIILAFVVNNTNAQVPTPAPKQNNSVLILNATAHLGNGKVIDNAAIGFKDGKFTLVADARVIKINPAEFDTIIYAQGKHVYPGFIAPNSTLGLAEIDAVRATRDVDETGTFNPHVRSVIAYNTDSKITPTVRSNGVLIAQITPRGGIISGTSSIVQLDAWNWEDAVVKENDGIHLNWIKKFHHKGWWAESGGIEKNKNYDKNYNELLQFFKDAKAYSKVKDHEKINLRFEAMRGVFNGEKTLFIHANYIKEITEAINFVKTFEIPKVVLVGAHDAYLIPEVLKENNIAVLLQRVHSLPENEEEPIDFPYQLPSILIKNGVLVALENSGDMERMNTRNLPFYAGTAAAYGLDKETALQLITLNTAKILGIDDKLGSIEPTKDATFFISEGDALDMKTNKVVLAFINGRSIDLNNSQKMLYEKYMNKYKNQ